MGQIVVIVIGVLLGLILVLSFIALMMKRMGSGNVKKKIMHSLTRDGYLVCSGHQSDEEEIIDTY